MYIYRNTSLPPVNAIVRIPHHPILEAETRGTEGTTNQCIFYSNRGKSNC